MRCHLRRTDEHAFAFLQHYVNANVTRNDALSGRSER